MWAAVAIHRSGNPTEALDVLVSHGDRSFFTHSIRCSIASKVGEKEFDSSLQNIFDAANPTKAETRLAYLRLVLSKLVLQEVEVSDRTEEIGHAYDLQIAHRQRGQPLLRDLLREEDRPWLAIVCAFAPSFSRVSVSEFLALIADDAERRRA